MAIFRVEKTQNYTVMSNHHLRNQSLTLKAKGLLSQMLSLPDEWDFTLSGLSAINKEKIDAIRQAVRELECAGYIRRSRVRDSKGRLAGTEYVIYELPQERPDAPPQTDPADPEPILDYPTLENPTLDNPTLENPTQLNKERTSKERLSKDPINGSKEKESIQDRLVAHQSAPAPSKNSKAQVGELQTITYTELMRGSWPCRA